MPATPQQSPGSNQAYGTQPFTPATVSVGTISITDESSQYNKAVVGDGTQWTDTLIENHFIADKHTVMMSVTSPGGFNGDSVAFCKLGTDTLTWICEGTIQRVGAEPLVPQAEPTDPNIILLDEYFSPAMLELEPDGATVRYRISFRLAYGFKNPSQAELMHPRPPWMAQTISGAVPPSAFVTGISSTDPVMKGGSGETADQ